MCALSGRLILPFFFFLMIGLPPRSTLFPYAPLFRSVAPQVLERVVSGAALELAVHQCRNRFIHRSEEHTSELQSRGLISYAVFFLKKKKKESSTNDIDMRHWSSTSPS